MNTVSELIAAIGKGKGAKFVSFKYKAKETGEVAKHTLILGFSEEKLYEKDVMALETIYEQLPDGTVDKVAAKELLESRKKSLEVGIGNNPEYTCKDVYVYPEGLHGVKVHKEDGSLHIHGLQEHKTVLVPGTYKEVKSSDKTIAKNKIRKELPSGRFRQFRLMLSNILAAKVNGETLEFEVLE